MASGTPTENLGLNIILGTDRMIPGDINESMEILDEKIGAIGDSTVKGLIDGKVNTSDIINNLSSTATNKPLSAAQGKALSDTIVANTQSEQYITTGTILDKIRSSKVEKGNVNIWFAAIGISDSPDSTQSFIIRACFADGSGVFYAYADKINGNDYSNTFVRKGKIDLTTQQATWYSSWEEVPTIVRTKSGTITCEKFSNGTMIIHGTATTTNCRMTTAWGTGLYYGTANNISFPVPFIETPNVTICQSGGASSGSSSFMVMNVIPTTIALTDIQIARGTSATANITVGFVAIGKWK